MTERLKALGRVRALSGQMKRAADWRLIAAERDARDAALAREAVDRFIDEGAPTGALAGVALRQSRRSGTREAAAAADAAAAAAAAREASARQKLVERRFEEVAREERAQAERRALERLIEGLVARGGAPPDA